MKYYPAALLDNCESDAIGAGNHGIDGNELPILVAFHGKFI